MPELVFRRAEPGVSIGYGSRSGAAGKRPSAPDSRSGNERPPCLTVSASGGISVEITLAEADRWVPAEMRGSADTSSRARDTRSLGMALWVMATSQSRNRIGHDPKPGPPTILERSRLGCHV